MLPGVYEAFLETVILKKLGKLKRLLSSVCLFRVSVLVSTDPVCSLMGQAQTGNSAGLLFSLVLRVQA